MHNIAIFCGSKFGNNPNYLTETNILCTILGQQKKHIIYGGGNVGLMGAVAKTIMENGGTVTGIIPKFLNSVERKNDSITNCIVTETMHERKRMLFEKSDMAIILPGGFGTLDELFELLTWNQLELHKLPVIILNINGFYDNLLSHINKMVEEGFLYNGSEKTIRVITNGSQIIDFIN
jgi:uncharacterized protein (TIGR00730 family)